MSFIIPPLIAKQYGAHLMLGQDGAAGVFSIAAYGPFLDLNSSGIGPAGFHLFFEHFGYGDAYCLSAGEQIQRDNLTDAVLVAYPRYAQTFCKRKRNG
jgi:hypothetical protein